MLAHVGRPPNQLAMTSDNHRNTNQSNCEIIQSCTENRKCLNPPNQIDVHSSIQIIFFTIKKTCKTKKKSVAFPWLRSYYPHGTQRSTKKDLGKLNWRASALGLRPISTKKSRTHRKLDMKSLPMPEGPTDFSPESMDSLSMRFISAPHK